MNKQELEALIMEEILLEKKKRKQQKGKKRAKKVAARKKKKKKRDACYYKVKSRYKIWPSAYASGALVRCRKVGAKNWGNKKKKTNENLDEIEQVIQEVIREVIAEQLDEKKTDGKRSSSKDYSLRDWFDKEGWVQVGGKYDGKPCARQPGQKTKPYCRDPDDRKAMSKKERVKRTKKKRKEDPNPNRKGKAKRVTQSKKKSK